MSRSTQASCQRRLPIRTTSGWAVLIALLLAHPTSARGTTVDDLCAADDDPCVVSGTVAVDDDSIINAGPRELQVRGRLDVGSGTMTLVARRLVVEGRLAAASSTAPGGTVVALARSIQITGGIDAQGAPGGRVVLASGEDLDFAGSADLDHLGEEEGGGDLTLSGANVTIAGTVTSRGGADASGGDVTVTAQADLFFDGSIDLTGGDGGTIDFTAGDGGRGDLTIGGNANLQSNATGKGCDGGDVELAAEGGMVLIGGRLDANGRGGDEDTGGGSGGSFTVVATGDVVVPSSGTRLNLTGATPDGFGGDVEISSDSAVSIRGVIDVHAGGNDGAGGSLTIDAGGGVSLQANVLAFGDAGGDLDITSAGDELRVGRGVELEANATGGGGGGDVAMTSDGALVVEGTIRSDGSSAFGTSTIALTACSLRIERSGLLSSTRNGGRNVLIGRDETLVAGRVVADPSSGVNEFRFASAAQRPLVLESAVVEPPPDEIVDPAVQPCGPTATATRTATATPTPTPSPRPPVACVGDCNGDGAVDLAEVVVATNVALGHLLLTACERIDADEDGRATVAELIAAVDASLVGCVR